MEKNCFSKVGRMNEERLRDSDGYECELWGQDASNTLGIFFVCFAVAQCRRPLWYVSCGRFRALLPVSDKRLQSCGLQLFLVFFLGKNLVSRSGRTLTRKNVDLSASICGEAEAVRVILVSLRQGRESLIFFPIILWIIGLETHRCTSSDVATLVVHLFSVVVARIVFCPNCGTNGKAPRFVRHINFCSDSLRLTYK